MVPSRFAAENPGRGRQPPPTIGKAQKQDQTDSARARFLISGTTGLYRGRRDLPKFLRRRFDYFGARSLPNPEIAVKQLTFPDGTTSTVLAYAVRDFASPAVAASWARIGNRQRSSYRLPREAGDPGTIADFSRTDSRCDCATACS